MLASSWVPHLMRCWGVYFAAMSLVRTALMAAVVVASLAASPVSSAEAAEVSLEREYYDCRDYNPGLRRAGASDAHRHSCMSTWPGVEAPLVTRQTIWTFPANAGRAPFAQLASEAPFLPQQKVGIPKSRTTGPYLYVWTASPPPPDLPDWYPEPIGYTEAGEPIYDESKQRYDELIAQIENWPTPLGRLVSGSLVSSTGAAVPVIVIDDSVVEGFVGEGNGWLLPVRPLKPRTTYRATVVLAPEAGQSNPYRETYIWTFRTTGSRLLPW
jgi:hypothetical protein